MSSLYGDWGTLAFVLAGALVGGFVNGLTGFGTGLTALPLWLQAVEPLVAAQLVSAASVVGHVTMLPAIWHAIDWRRLAPMLVAGLVGVPIGTWVLPWISLAVFKSLVGCLLIGYCAFMLFAAGRVRLSAGGRGAEAVVGLFGGVLGGLAGLSGALPTVWATLKGWPKDERRMLFQAFNMTHPVGHAGGEPGAGPDRAALPDGAGRGAAGTLFGVYLGSLLVSPPGRSPLRPHRASCCCLCRGWASCGQTAEHLSYLRSLAGQERIIEIGSPDKGESMLDARVHCGLAILAALASCPAARFPAAQETEGCGRKAPETEEEKKERETRKACAVALCSTLHNHKPHTGDVTCNVQKTWRKEVLVKIMERGKVTWPWGNARCISDLKFDRATLVKGMTEPEFEAQFDKHDIRCELEGEKEKYEVKLQIQPKVTFKQGKAVKASLNWGKIEAPKLAKTALWSATAADNSFGVLQRRRRRGHQRVHSDQVHGGEGGVAGQVASLASPRRGLLRAGGAFCAWPCGPCGACSGRRIAMTTAIYLIVSGVP